MKKNGIIAVLIVFCLTTTLFMVAYSVSYDPWADINDDGKIDMRDIGYIAKLFGTAGTPIDKAALVLELATARAHKEAYSTTLETRSGYDWGWQDMPGMTVTITTQTTCTLLIMFSAEAQTGTDFLEIYVRAMVDANLANPSTGVTLTKLMDWASHSFTFYKPNVAPGNHTIKIQWSYNDEVGSVQVRGRTLVVTSLLE